jgi:SagB-type dehydrogenase family enzyme
MRDRGVGAVAALLAAVALAGGCVPGAPDAVLERSDRFDPPLELPAPDRIGETALEQVLDERRSRRSFADTELSLATIGQLFWAGQGVTDDAGYRTAPSAGALYPLELYAVTASHLLHYLPDGHRVEQRSDGTALAGLADAAFGQDWVSSAPVVLVVVGVVARTQAKYGAIADDLMRLEAGHATQNVLLQATALDLAATPVGGFDPADVGELLALPPGHEVLYLVPIGAPSR